MYIFKKAEGTGYFVIDSAAPVSSVPFEKLEGLQYVGQLDARVQDVEDTSKIFSRIVGSGEDAREVSSAYIDIEQLRRVIGGHGNYVRNQITQIKKEQERIPDLQKELDGLTSLESRLK